METVYGETREQLAIHAGGDIASRGYDGLNWSAWKHYCTATPPMEYDLPLAAGWEIKNAAKYWKDQFGQVSLSFRIGKSIPPATQGTIGTLPEGYRPSHPIHSAAVSYPGLSSALLVIGTDGSILVFFNGQEAGAEGSFCGTATFVAAT